MITLPEKYEKALRLFDLLGMDKKQVIMDSIEEKVHEIFMEAAMDYKFNRRIDLDLFFAVRKAFTEGGKQ